jgi:uncharacterized iron-regulated membrane protein
VTNLSDTTPHLEGLTTDGEANGTKLTPEEAIAIAAELFPDAKFDHFHPANGDGVYEVAFRQPGEVQQSFGRTQVFIEPYTGEVLAVRDPQKFTFADHFIAWQFPLHNGEAFGLVGRLIVFGMGLTPTVLYVTGCIVWWRRRPRITRSAATHNARWSMRRPSVFQRASSEHALIVLCRSSPFLVAVAINALALEQHLRHSPYPIRSAFSRGRQIDAVQTRHAAALVTDEVGMNALMGIIGVTVLESPDMIAQFGSHQQTGLGEIIEIAIDGGLIDSERCETVGHLRM